MHHTPEYKFKVLHKRPFSTCGIAGHALIKRRKSQNRPCRFAIVGYISDKFLLDVEPFSTDNELTAYAWLNNR